MTTAQSTRSTFVSVVAWIFIVLNGFGTLIAILQNVMINLLFPMKEMQQAIHDPHRPPVPLVGQFILGHIQLLAAAVLVVMVAALVSSVGLLRRKNWARKLFILFLIIGLVWNLVGLVSDFFFFVTPQALKISANAPPDFAAHANTFLAAFTVITLFISVVITTVLAWIIKRLVSEEVKEEFGVYAYD